MEMLLSKIRTIGFLSASVFLLLISFFGGIYLQHSISILENSKSNPDPSIILIKQKGYASILSSFDHAAYAIENKNPPIYILIKYQKHIMK